jgi:hypothetical protein
VGLWDCLIWEWGRKWKSQTRSETPRLSPQFWELTQNCTWRLGRWNCNEWRFHWTPNQTQWTLLLLTYPFQTANTIYMALSTHLCSPTAM